jgi:hypothetical protein
MNFVVYAILLGCVLMLLGWLRIYWGIRQALRESEQSARTSEPPTSAPRTAPEVLLSQFSSLYAGHYFIYQGQSFVVEQRVELDSFHWLAHLDNQMAVLCLPTWSKNAFFLMQPLEVLTDYSCFLEAQDNSAFFVLPHYAQYGKWKIMDRKTQPFRSREEGWLKKKGHLTLFLLKNNQIGQYACWLATEEEEEGEKPTVGLFYGNSFFPQRQVEYVGLLDEPPFEP